MKIKLSKQLKIELLKAIQEGTLDIYQFFELAKADECVKMTKEDILEIEQEMERWYNNQLNNDEIYLMLPE